MHEAPAAEVTSSNLVGRAGWHVPNVCGKGGCWRASSVPLSSAFGYAAALRTTGWPYREILQALIATFADPGASLAFSFRFRGPAAALDSGFSVTYGIAATILLPRAVRMGLKVLQRKSALTPRAHMAPCYYP
jgi:hypothetical protein